MMSQSDLFMVKMGSGAPFVALHMGPGLDHTYMRPWLERLADERQLVFYDLRGNGRSPEPVSWEGVTHADWVDDLEAVRRELGVEQITLFGHSYGGYIALEYAIRHPEHVRGLIACGSAASADDNGESGVMAAARATPEQMRVLIEDFSRPSTTEPHAFAEMFAKILPLYFHSMEPDFDSLFGETHFRPDAFNHMFFNCRPHYDVVSSLGKVDVPTLILHGRHDWIAPIGPCAERMQHLMPNAHLQVFENSGHFPFIEENERFLAVLRSWLDQLPANVAT